jgi:hypothetical protein
MGLTIINTLIVLCSTSALEDAKGKWSKLPVVEQHRNQCIVFYLDCIKKGKTWDDYSERLITCIRERTKNDKSN